MASTYSSRIERQAGKWRSNARNRVCPVAKIRCDTTERARPSVALPSSYCRFPDFLIAKLALILFGALLIFAMRAGADDARSLTQAEYFWDADPGQGHGTPVYVPSGESFT